MSEIETNFGLPFQLEILNEIHKSDGIVIAARGINLLRIVTELLKGYDSSDGIILVINADKRDIEWIGQELAVSLNPSPLSGLRVITNEGMPAPKREATYRLGGVISVTSRILIADLLTNVVDINLIVGMVVLNAERISDTSLESWILRLYRKRNKSGFIKAFSEYAELFTRKFNFLEKTTRNLRVPNVFLWPRFQWTMSRDLEAVPTDVIELAANLTPNMQTIQRCLYESAKETIKEIKRLNSKHLNLEDEDWDLDANLHLNFDSMIQSQLDPIWHRLTYKSRQLCRDLSVLRSLMQYLLSYDPVDFLKVVEIIVASNSDSVLGFSERSPWLYLTSAQTLIQTARDRVMNDPETIEPLPKWTTLSEVLTEIRSTLSENDGELLKLDTNASVVIFCNDKRTCYQIQEYLTQKNQVLGKRQEFANWKKNLSLMQVKGFTAPEHKATSGRPTEVYKRRRVRGGSSGAQTYRSIRELKSTEFPRINVDEITHILLKDGESPNAQSAPSETLESSLSQYFGIESIAVLTYNGDMDQRALYELKPLYVIIYDVNLALIRRLEVFRSEFPDRYLRIYFIYYSQSLEERRYISSIRREKDAFSQLIKEKADLALNLQTAEKDDDDDLNHIRTINTRKAGGSSQLQVAQGPMQIVVDIREFRSSLPGILDRQGINLFPCQLTVGDYVICPEICIERKSVKDLIQSFQSGRLFAQIEAMSLHYKIPVLLIEFDSKQSFTLETVRTVASNTPIQNDLQTKLGILCLTFVKLRLIWSSDPSQSAKIIEDLKSLYDEPDIERAVKIGADPNQSSNTTMSELACDFLRKMPGINNQNIYNVIYNDKISNVHDLINSSEAEITEMIGPEAAKAMYSYLKYNIHKLSR